MQLEKEFIPFDIAKKIKELGFNEECFAYWKVEFEEPTLYQSLHIDKNKLIGYKCNQHNELIERPMWFQVYRWLKEKYNFDVSVNKQWREETWEWKLYLKDSSEALCDNFSEEPIESKEKAQELLMQRVFWKIANPNSVEETRGERMLRSLKEHLDSPGADEYFENLRIKDKIEKQRFLRFDEYLTNHSFDDLLKRLIDEHTEEYRRKCYSKGYEPLPTNKMQFLIDYVQERGKVQPLGSVEGNMFESELYFFKNYYFQCSQGQGCFWTIFDSNKVAIYTS